MFLRIFLLIILIFPVHSFSQENVEILIKKGNDAFDKLEFEKALSIYEDSLKAAPKDPVIFYNKGNVLQKQEKYDDALLDYNEAIKNDPEKILLKNIYFNAGNAHYKIAESKTKEGENDIEILKVALAEFESACNLFKKSLEVEREIAISKGYDIKNSGVYAKKNWALSREQWANTWEKIRLLEKKNMKLEDGINNLLIAQLDLLPRLEKYYLNSLTDDKLNFNLKTLAQFQLDHKEDISVLKELADKEVERANAELENYKAANNQGKKASQTSPPAPVSTLSEDPEKQKLEEQLNNAKEIQNAVIQAAGYTEWILDGFKRGEALKAWKNSFLMISLLQNLNDYLKKQDVVKNTYLKTLNLFKDVETMLFSKERALQNKNNKYINIFKSRIDTLSTEKLDAAALNFVTINAQLDSIHKQIESQLTKEVPAAGQIPDKEKSVLSDYFKNINTDIVKISLDDVIKHNEDVLGQIKSTASEFLKGNTRSDQIGRIINGTSICLDRYDNFGKSIVELMTYLIQSSDGVIDVISGISDESFGRAHLKFADSLKQMDILLFKYDYLISDIQKTKEKELLLYRKKLPVNYKNINTAWQNWTLARSTPFLKKKDVSAFKKLTRTIKTELIRGLTILAPEVAASLYYEKIQKLNKEALEQLPSSALNSQALLDNLKQTKSEMSDLDTVLKAYFETAEEMSGLIAEEDKKEESLKQLRFRKKSMDKLASGIREIDDSMKYIKDSRFLKTDFLIKDLPSTVGKSYLNFMGYSGDAAKILESTIGLQKAIEEQNRAIMEIESQEGGSIKVNPYLVENQRDVMELSGISTMKIRQMIDENSKQKNGDNPLMNQGQGGQTCPSADPEKLEEAIGFIQDAIIEEQKIHSFLEAREYNNALDKHPRVIELLNKALELLKNKDQNGQDENNQDQKKENGEQDQNRQQNNDRQQQSGQQQQQGGKEKSQPLQLTPEQARELLNRLDKEDDKRHEGEVQERKPMDVPRPW